MKELFSNKIKKRRRALLDQILLFLLKVSEVPGEACLFNNTEESPILCDDSGVVTEENVLTRRWAPKCLGVERHMPYAPPRTVQQKEEPIGRERADHRCWCGCARADPAGR